MKEEWKVYIKGVPNRGDEVIKALIDLGGKNGESFNGDNDDYVYFITHTGEVDNERIYTETAKIIMDNYKEIKLPEKKQFGKWDWKPEWKWKPEQGDPYWIINSNGYVDTYCWCNDALDKSCFNFGNCFRTKEEAEAMAKAFNKLLNAKV